jgi:GNAT superfamily N-acetyltransferase
MDIQKEQLVDTVMELDALIRDYFARTKAQEGIPPLRMNWKFYTDLAVANRLAVFTARTDDGALLGFAMYILGHHPQHGGMPFAMCNTLAVDVSHRSQGVGTLLVEAALAYFKDTDIKMVMHGYRTIYDAEPLFPKLGFDLIEHIYMKVL